MPIRSICNTDWPEIMAIQNQCYLEFISESLVVMQSKWLTSPTTCTVFEDDNRILAYALTHPWQRGDAPSLDSELTDIAPANCLYLHDMAISPEAQGMGLGKLLLSNIISIARQLTLDGIGLVAVQGAQTYWQQRGFMPAAPSNTLLQSLNSYPPGACYLYLPLTQA